MSHENDCNDDLTKIHRVAQSIYLDPFAPTPNGRFSDAVMESQRLQYEAFQAGALWQRGQGSTQFLLKQNLELREQRAGLMEKIERLEREHKEYVDSATDIICTLEEERDRWKADAERLAKELAEVRELGTVKQRMRFCEENARLREALERIAELTKDITMRQPVYRIAWAVLREGEK